jgi:hypothetical protein
MLSAPAKAKARKKKNQEIDQQEETIDHLRSTPTQSPPNRKSGEAKALVDSKQLDLQFEKGVKA